MLRIIVFWRNRENTMLHNKVFWPNHESKILWSQSSLKKPVKLKCYKNGLYESIQNFIQTELDERKTKKHDFGTNAFTFKLFKLMEI